MVIDDRIEALVRGALGAVVKEDGDKLDAALGAFPDQESLRQGLQIANAICMFIVFEEYDGRPTVEETRLLAESVAGLSSWAGIRADDANTYFTTVLNGQPLVDAMDAQSAVMLTFLITGNMLASSEKIGKDEWWFNYLDRVEAAIEATSGA